MSDVRIYCKVNYVFDPPNLPEGKLFVAVFYKQTGLTMCLTGLYHGIKIGYVVLETIDELTCDPEPLPRLSKIESIPWDNVEMMVILGECELPPDVPVPTLTPLSGRPPIPNDVPLFYPGTPIESSRPNTQNQERFPMHADDEPTPGTSSGQLLPPPNNEFN